MKTTKCIISFPFISAALLLSFMLFFGWSCGKDSTEPDPPCTTQEWFRDADKDNQGNAATSIDACEQPDGYVGNSLDPDDGNSDITSDCTMITYYPDNDEDHYGKDGDDIITQCSGLDAPTGYVEDNSDCDDTDPDTPYETTAYLDSDQDGYGDPEVSIDALSCEPPHGYSFDSSDCDDTDPDTPYETTAYLDNDQDGYGDPEVSIDALSCEVPDGYSFDGTDCNDADDTIHPGATDNPYDGIDKDCDGTYETPPTIWDGPNVNFVKAANEDWTLPEHQDKLTDKVTLTRQNNNVYLYNYQWWQDQFNEDAEHLVGEGSDLAWEFYGEISESIKEMGNITPTGGVKGVRFALLDDTGADNLNSAWDNFQLYGELGDPTHFYSWHNMASIVKRLNQGFDVPVVVNDFTIHYNVSTVTSEVRLDQLVGKRLGVWLMEENIFLTLTITSWSDNGGAFSYTRSTPNNNN